MRISSTNSIDTTKKAEMVQPNFLNQQPTINTEQIGGKNDQFLEMTDQNGQPTKQAYQTAVNKLNEFMEYHNKNSKFVYHEDLERYYVEIVDSQTEEVIKEIPPKELLDAYYEMQKMIGKVIDKTV